MYESWFECAEREVMEEMNIELTDLQFAHVTNDIMEEEEKHYITLFIMGRPVEGSSEPQTMEPDKCEEWGVYSWDQLKSFSTETSPDLFGPLKHLIDKEPENVLNYIQKS